MAVASATVAFYKGLTECSCLLLHSSHFQKKNDAGFTSKIEMGLNYSLSFSSVVRL